MLPENNFVNKMSKGTFKLVIKWIVGTTVRSCHFQIGDPQVIICLFIWQIFIEQGVFWIVE